ncbi:MAG: hypothetical protein GEU75_08255 [Dehalococcoidia bacterium]|nr:hypothetical protein [Dehalococcoidia bacterium]
MWVAGVLLLFVAGGAVSLTLSWRQRPAPAMPLWDIPRVAGSYTTIVGSLAGFTVASAVFIANVTRGSVELEAAVGMFILAFLVLIASTMQFATTPNLGGEVSTQYLSDQHLSYMMANATFYIGIAISWLGLRLLLLAIDFTDFAGTLTWVLLSAMILGSLRLSMHVYRHTTTNPIGCFALVPVGFSLALAYRWLAEEVWGDLWPSEDQPLHFAVVAFFVAGAAYAYQTALLTLHGNPAWERLLARIGQKWLVMHAQAAVMVIFLLWIAVAQA